MPDRATDPQRVVVFIDYMNVYNDARRAFGDAASAAPFGQINPMRYGWLLASRIPLGEEGARTLKQVRVYRGEPDPRREGTTHGAFLRQVRSWKDAGVEVVTRPLRYPPEWPKAKAEEKGIDVELAIDMALMAIRDELDVAILASTDTDLRPALEAYFKLPDAPPPVAETAAWRSPQLGKQLRVPGKHVWCHYLEEEDFERVRDRRDYNIGRER